MTRRTLGSWTPAAALLGGAALLVAPVLRGFGLLDLWARVLGVPDTAVRALATVVLAGVAAGAFWMARRRPDWALPSILAFVLALSVFTLAGRLGHEAWWLELFAHFPWQYAAGLLAAALCLLALGRSRMALLATSVALLNLLIASPQLSAWPRVKADSGPVMEETVRLATANLHKRNDDAPRVLRFVAEAAPDVLVLQELTPEWKSRLAPLAQVYPHSVTVPREDGFGIALFSRYPIDAHEVLRFPDPSFPSIAARIDVAGRPLGIVGTHPPAPRNERLHRTRNRIFSHIAELAARSDEPLVVLGDLNCTPWAPSFRRFLREGGLSDTSEGRRLSWSWPAGFWPLAIPIDHALVTGDVRVVHRHMGPDIGSDHYPLVVDVTLPLAR